jgi:hypothetical protein
MVFCCLEKVERVSCKFTDHFFLRNTKKCDYPVNRICYYIARCLTFETVLFFFCKEIFLTSEPYNWHNQRIACLTSTIPALSNRYENHGFFKYEIQRPNVMAAVGTWEFSQKCYVFNISYSLSLAMVNSNINEICHRRDSKHI